jgi:hypothetical protein
MACHSSFCEMEAGNGERPGNLLYVFMNFVCLYYCALGVLLHPAHALPLAHKQSCLIPCAPLPAPHIHLLYTASLRARCPWRAHQTARSGPKTKLSNCSFQTSKTHQPTPLMTILIKLSSTSAMATEKTFSWETSAICLTSSLSRVVRAPSHRSALLQGMRKRPHNLGARVCGALIKTDLGCNKT